MIELLRNNIIPAALSLLPEKMDTPEARAILIPSNERPAVLPSIPQRSEPDARFARQLGQRIIDSIDDHATSASTVIALLSPRRPFTVARLVISVVVYAVKAVIVGRPRSDAGNKSREVVSPFVAHPNAARAVSLVVRVFRVVAARLCGSPRPVFRRCFVESARTHVAGMVVNGMQGDSSLSLIAAAAFRFPGSKVLWVNDRRISTITFAQPLLSAGMVY